MLPPGKPIAHLHIGEEETREQPLQAHLDAVARTAGEFAAEFGSRDWAELAGRWHDLGKARRVFQEYLRNAAQAEAAGEKRPRSPGHSISGAILAREHFGERGGLPLAYCIGGHHAGLADYDGDGGRGALSKRLDDDAQLQELRTEEIVLPAPNVVPTSHSPGGDWSLWIRLLFSCLVDADFLDTEAFMNPEQGRVRQRFPDLETLGDSLDRYLVTLMAWAPNTQVNRVRREVLQACRRAAVKPPGLFSLTVPTGGGKTLSAMAFAMAHALSHGKRRIIYVTPYTSIVEQTAETLTEVFGPEAIIEHHSALSEDRDNLRNRLASENWDAPVIVSTAVQFFESLFAARPGRCRKLHNIVNSLVLIDETQLLPTDFLRPIIQTLQELADNYGVTVVLSTATQPNLEERTGLDGRFPGLRDIREIISDPVALATRLSRVSVEIPEDLSLGRKWPELSKELANHAQILCVVNTRRDCRDLHAQMPKGTIHLSALMCPQHRSDVIRNIKACLKTGQPVRVISTQLIEAGVDLDFPVVYRALCGLDSIAQAAGRCNREGQSTKGRVVVFVPPHRSPPGLLRQSSDIARGMLSAGLDDPLSPVAFRRYFTDLYLARGSRLDSNGILDLLKTRRSLSFRFRTADRKFQLIDDQGQESVIVRYGQCEKALKRFDCLLSDLERWGPSRYLLRQLQRYSVSIPARVHSMFCCEARLRDVHGIWVQEDDGLYHQTLGLMTGEPEDYRTEDLVMI